MNNYCKCFSVIPVRQAFNGVLDEAKEFIAEPSKDELVDVLFCLNRLAGSVVKKVYIGIFPVGDHYDRKVRPRMQEYNCIRSKRHLINGKCPSL